jgi:class 3 adenylate cyclase
MDPNEEIIVDEVTKLIRTKHPTKAVERAEEGIKLHPKSLLLKYLRLLAFRRGGNASDLVVQQAKVLDDDARIADDRRLQGDIRSLLGALYKMRYERNSRPAAASAIARSSADWYELGYNLNPSAYPCINKATMLLLVGRLRHARNWADRAVNAAKNELAAKPDDYWALATLGEANVILGKLPDARNFYRQATDIAREHEDDRITMKKNLLLLKQKIDIGDVLDLFDFGTVVVFAGHMIDNPLVTRRHGRPPRFPDDRELEKHVGDAIQAQIEQLNARIGYTSVACGSDILFAEQMIDRGYEVHIVLPYDKADFFDTSVDFGLPQMARWRSRAERVLNEAERRNSVHYATNERFMGDRVLHEFVSAFAQGLAITHASKLRSPVRALVVMEPKAKRYRGGTRYFVDHWNAMGCGLTEINLRQLRENISTVPDQGQGPLLSPTLDANEDDRIRRQGNFRVARQVKAMLFADVCNYSKLTDLQVPIFVPRFIAALNRAISKGKPAPDFCNTWGDSLYAVYDKPEYAAGAAMRVLEEMERIDWEKFELPRDLAARIGLHCGPVFSNRDPLIGKTNFFGAHVTTAARIEPVTLPGCAYASEQFAAALTASRGNQFFCEFVGVEELHKKYARCALYRLGRQ